MLNVLRFMQNSLNWANVEEVHLIGTDTKRKFVWTISYISEW